MVIGYGFLVIPGGGDSRIFDEAVMLMHEKRKAERSYRREAPTELATFDTKGEEQ